VLAEGDLALVGVDRDAEHGSGVEVHEAGGDRQGRLGVVEIDAELR
jgi:hypothetical protein